MATTYRLTDTVSDLSGGADFSAVLLRSGGPSPPAPPAPGSHSVTIGSTDTDISFAWTVLDDPNNADWQTGTITIEVEVTTADSAISLALRARRVDSSGTIQESGTATTGQLLSSTGQFNFTIPSKDWSAGDVGDRIRIDYLFENTALHGNNTVVIETNTDLTEHVTQITFNESPQTQIFVAGPGAQPVDASETWYNTVLSARVPQGFHESTENTFQLIGTPGTLRNLRIDLDTPVTDGAITFTIRLNQVDTGLEVVIDADDNGSDLTTDLTVVAGDQINMKIVSDSGTNTVEPRWSLEFEGDNDKAFNVSAGTSNLIANSASIQFNSLMHQSTWSTVSSDRIQVCPLDATIREWYLELDAAPGVGESWTFRLLVNETSDASSEIVISGTNTTGNATGLLISVLAGNTLQMQTVRSGIGVVQSRVQSGVAFQAANLGESWVGGWSLNLLTKVDAVEEYNLFGSAGSTWVPNSSDNLQGIGGSYTLKNFRLIASAEPGGTGDHEYLFKIRKNDAAGNSLLKLEDADTTDVDTTNTDSFVPGDTIGISHQYNLLNTGTPNDISITWAAVQTIDAGANIVVTPTALTAVAAVVDPTVIQSSMTVAPAALTTVAAVVDPTVVNVVLLTPAALTTVATVVNPTVILGSMTVTPAALTAVAATVAPTVILGSLTATPAALTAVAATVDPTVILGSMTVIPSARTMVAAVVAPLVILGSMSVTPAATTVVAAVVDPTVVLSGGDTQKQIFIAGPGQFNLAGSLTRYNTVLSTINGNANWESTEATFQLIATPGTLRNLRIQLDTAITSGSMTFTIRKNAIDTALKVVMTSGTSEIDITNDVTVVAGDQINLKVVTVNVNAVQSKFGLEFEGDNDKEFNMSAGTSLSLNQVASPQFNTLIHHESWNTDGGDRINVCPLDGTITDWYLELPTAPGTGESWTFRLVKNLTSEASSEIVISGTGKTGNVTGLSIDIAPGDEIQMQAIRSSASVVLSQVQSGVAIKSDTAGESWVGGNTDDGLTKTDTVTEFNLMGGGDKTWSTNESANLQYAAGAFTLKDFRVRTNAGPGGTTDHKYTFRLRKDEADGNSVVTIIDAETDKVDSSNEDSYSTGTEIGVSHRYDLTGSGTPANMLVSWAAIQTIDDNIVVTPAALTAVAAVVNPTVILGSMTVTPAALTAVAAVVNPTVLNFVLLTPTALTTVAATVNPTVILGSMTVTPAALTAIAATVDPTVILGSMTVTPAAITAIAAVVDPTVVLSGGDIVVTPAALTVVAATVNPTVILGSMTVTPAALTIVASTVDPTVLNFVLFTPAALTTVAATIDPTVILSSMTVVPSATTSVAATVNPTVIQGSMTVTPAALTVVATVVDPTVVLGGAIVTPAALTIVAATVNPTVILGSMSVTPAALTVIAATVDPTVILGSITLTPSALTVVAATVDPTVIFGSLTVTPAALTAVALTLAPTVINSGDIVIEIFTAGEGIFTASYSSETIDTAKHSNEEILID